MEIHEEKLTETRFLSASVSGTPDVHKAYSKQVFRPELVSATFQKVAEDGWRVSQLRANGGRVLKSGEIGLSLSENWYRHGEAPEWLATWAQDRADEWNRVELEAELAVEGSK